MRELSEGGVERRISNGGHSNPNNSFEDASMTTLTGTAISTAIGSAVFGRVLNYVRKRFGTLPDYLKENYPKL